MNARDMLTATLVVWLWGLNFIAIRLGVAEIPPLLLTALRFVLLSALVVPFVAMPRGRLRLVALLSLVLGVGHFGLLFVGIKGLGAATSAIALQLTAPFSAIIALVVYKERMSLLGLAGMAAAFLGILFLAGEPQRPDFFSLLMVVGAAFFWSLSNVVIKKIGPINPIALNGWMALFAAPMLAGLSLLTEHGQVGSVLHAGWRGWGAVIYTALIASLIAHSLWYMLIGRLSLNKAVPFTLLNPVIGVAAAVVLLGESLSWQKIFGGLLTIAGVAVIQAFPHRPQGTDLVES